MVSSVLTSPRPSVGSFLGFFVFFLFLLLRFSVKVEEEDPEDESSSSRGICFLRSLDGLLVRPGGDIGSASEVFVVCDLMYLEDPDSEEAVSLSSSPGVLDESPVSSLLMLSIHEVLLSMREKSTSPELCVLRPTCSAELPRRVRARNPITHKLVSLAWVYQTAHSPHHILRNARSMGSTATPYRSWGSRKALIGISQSP